MIVQGMRRRVVFLGVAADYLLVVVVAVVLHASNVVGYTKCSKQASAQLKSYATQAMASGLTVRLLLDVSVPTSLCACTHRVCGCAVGHSRVPASALQAAIARV